MSKKQQEARALDVKGFYDVAKTVQIVIAELGRIKNSVEFSQIVSKSGHAIKTTTEAVEDVRQDVTDIVALALQLYDKSLLKGRSLAEPKSLKDVTTTDDLLDHMLARLAQEG